jgi:hypothetical protein
MDTAELIAREVADLPDDLRAEVLDFIGYLKSRHPAGVPSASEAARRAELSAFFAPYRRDFGDFVFDREEANAR